MESKLNTYNGHLTNTSISSRTHESINTRRLRVTSPEILTSVFLVSRDDNDLLKRISQGDDCALFQFAGKHLGLLSSFVLKFGPPDSGCKLMDICLSSYLSEIKGMAQKYSSLSGAWEMEFVSMLSRRIPEVMSKACEKNIRFWKRIELTTESICILNQLNSFLLRLERRMVTQARSFFKSLEKPAPGSGLENAACEYYVSIRFFQGDDLIYTWSHRFDEDLLSEQDPFFETEDDWRVGGWLPDLHERCGYLMHELAYHSYIRDRIFDITRICVDFETIGRSLYESKEGQWEASHL